MRSSTNSFLFAVRFGVNPRVCKREKERKGEERGS